MAANKLKKQSVKVRDLRPPKDPKGGVEADTKMGPHVNQTTPGVGRAVGRSFGGAIGRS